MRDVQLNDLTRAPDDAFHFGRNWQRYVTGYLNDERKDIAATSLRSLLQQPLEGRSFLDIGCGSGLFSLCAWEMGASRVTSLDVDAESTESCKWLRNRSGQPDNWEITDGSILDRAVVEQLAPADVVYSWGVLHHTGDMFRAIAHAASLVAPGGLFAIAIYNRVERGFLNSARWWRIKRRYTHSRPRIQRLMEDLYTGYYYARMLRGRRNPWRYARDYKMSRGMALRTDLVDWLGGFPYQYASVEEIVDFCSSSCGLQLVRTVPVPGGGTGNNEFVFRAGPVSS